MNKGRVLSPVDYEAWGNGYMPPSEHVLIHELMYGGASVYSSTQHSSGGFWLVTKGDPFSDEDDLKIFELLAQSMRRRISRKKDAMRVIGQFAQALGAHNARLTDNENGTEASDDAEPAVKTTGEQS